MSTRKKTSKTKKKTDAIDKDSLGIPEPASPDPTTAPPARIHASSYHWPLLLSDKPSCDGLLNWFEGIEDDREMPWRKRWVNPTEFENPKELATVLSKRAYEVWVSEIMLQQTRVSTVIPYFNNWIAKWPTVQDLAKADHDEVLAMWKGLGYYSRATRLHQGAKDVVSQNDADCPIPSGAQQLLAVSGIGPYTAGAISSIAFGEAEPVLDGNVIRVLSRQLGLYVDGKDRKSSDLLWKVADRLVKHVSGFPEILKSATPGLWNQALMELGSTVCTPRPKCDSCPIQKTCRAYSEGETLAKKPTVAPTMQDIEDACSYCDELDSEDLLVTPEGEDEEESVKTTKKRKVEVKKTNTISNYFTANTRSTRSKVSIEVVDEEMETPSTKGDKKRKAASSSANEKRIVTYCSLFPKKVIKKKVAEEECAVCLVEWRTPGESSTWLIEQRPAKGLLASLWQFPQCLLSDSDKISAIQRKSSAQKFVSELEIGQTDLSETKHLAELGSLVHVFSHLKLTMHVQRFAIDFESDACPGLELPGPPRRRWVATKDMENETLSTGMRRCWELVKNDALL